MGLNSPFMASRTREQIRNGIIALLAQVLSMILTITGIAEIRASFSDSNVDMGDASDLVPWLTAIVIVFCVSVVLVDAYAFYGLIKDEAAVYCQRKFTSMLHGFNLFSTMFVSMCTLALAIGYVVKGLGESGLLRDSIDNNQTHVFYGLTAVELLGLYRVVDRYLNGAWLILIGAFISIPTQAWILAAMSVQVSFQEARQTMYKGGGGSTARATPRMTPRMTPAPVAYYDNPKEQQVYSSERASLISNPR